MDVICTFGLQIPYFCYARSQTFMARFPDISVVRSWEGDPDERLHDFMT